MFSRVVRISHTQTFSRVWLKDLNGLQHGTFFCIYLKWSFVIFVSHVSRTVIVVWLPCLLFHSTFLLCFFPRAVLNPAIHGQEDSLVDWPNKVLSQRHRAQRHCRVQRLHPCSCHQDEQISFRRTDLVRTLQLHLCFRKSMRDKACECWLHRCSCSRENQVQLQQEFVTLTDKVLCQARLTLKAQGALLRFTHTKRTSSRDPKSIIFAEHQSVRDYRNERIETGVPVKTRKGKPFSVERKQGECYLRISVEKATQSAFLAPKSQTQNDGKSCWKGKALRGRSPSGKRSRRPCKDYISGECTNPSCGSGHPPVCQHYKTQSGCKFGETCVFWHKEIDNQPNKKPKKSGGKGSVAFLKNSKQLGCVFQVVECSKSKSSLRNGTQSLGPKRSVHVSEGTVFHVKIRKERVHPKK